MTPRRTSSPSAADPVVRWRRGLLLRAGFPDDLAGALAGEGRYDLHALIGLAERGCPPGLAGRILAPLDDATHTAPEEPS